jgi:hypothetical protein
MQLSSTLIMACALFTFAIAALVVETTEVVSTRLPQSCEPQTK